MLKVAVSAGLANWGADRDVVKHTFERGESMRALIQRVEQASVTVGTEIVGDIGAGLLVLACAVEGDSEADADKLVAKISKLRIFSDDAGKMNRSVQDVSGAALVVSQFTLAADTRKGNRPSYAKAEEPERAAALVTRLADGLATEGIPVATGRFAAEMKVALVNDGPVTIWLDTRA